MKKVYWTIGVISIVGISIVLFTLFSTNITAQIPSASSYAPTFKNWTIHFSHRMNPETFTENTVVVKNKNNAVDVTFEWNEEHTVLTILPPEDGYTIEDEYQIQISNKVETASGKNLSKPYTHYFTAVKDVPRIEDETQLLTLLEERMKQNRQQGEVTVEDAESADTAGDETASLNDSAGSEASSTSDTNVQVDGIDEGDIVKTDGEYLYFARDRDIIIAKTDQSNSKVVSSIKEEAFQTQELFVEDDLLIAIGFQHKPIREVEEPTEQPNASRADMAIYPPSLNMQTTVYMYDISNQSTPEKVREFSLEGSLTASRKMDQQLFLVANNHPPYHILEEESSNGEVRPLIKDTATSKKAEPIDFNDMYFFPESDGENFMLLATIDLNDMEKEATIESYLGASNQVYMSENHLYTASRHYNTPESTKSDDTELAVTQPANTEIIQFKLGDGEIAHHASTVVNGTLINQFAMDERHDTFRVATTKGEMWGDDEPSTNNLYTFDLDLNPLGAVEGLAEGERIYSVRFMDDVAYMVTFRQVDPFYVIDLADAKNPEVLGELKIPGFSNYLHPLDENHVIGVGQHTELEETGGPEPIVRTAGLKLSIFDVSDPTNPQEKFTEIIGEGGSYSELNHNHKALYQHPSKNIFGFPAQLYETKMVQQGDATYERQSFVYEGAFLYQLSSEAGITLKDTITHQNDNIEHPEWEAQIKRMVSVNDYLYTLSFDLMKVYDIETESTVKTVELPEMPEW
ncbi:beta-propeller domain-containing protein [Oceanobacillus halotolerans]|uniref:beta-propeller domain-containing protein n=1 Tax=Oceanobacillus halotolerans TaxID=2663380 RepID=UPI0013DC0388|nr:beta-propeller domain-containing protein [Oceanobacillus halotolerans]